MSAREACKQQQQRCHDNTLKSVDLRAVRVFQLLLLGQQRAFAPLHKQRSRHAVLAQLQRDEALRVQVADHCAVGAHSVLLHQVVHVQNQVLLAQVVLGVGVVAVHGGGGLLRAKAQPALHIHLLVQSGHHVGGTAALLWILGPAALENASKQSVFVCDSWDCWRSRANSVGDINNILCKNI